MRYDRERLSIKKIKGSDGNKKAVAIELKSKPRQPELKLNQATARTCSCEFTRRFRAVVISDL